MYVWPPEWLVQQTVRLRKERNAQRAAFDAKATPDQILRGNILGPLPAKLTCDECVDNDKCLCAFDDYNTNGDCLADK